MNTRISTLILLCLIVLVLAGCATGGTPLIVTSNPTTSNATAIPPTDTVAPTETPLAPTETPTQVPPTATTPPVNAIAHFASGQAFTVTSLSMIDANLGWAIGGLGSVAGDHIFTTTDGGSSWKDVTPFEEQAAADTHKSATGFFQSTTSAWVTYAIGGGTPVPARPVVWHTTDGGATWTASQPLDVTGLSEIYVPTDLQFVGQQAGWLLAHVGVGMNHDYVVIYHSTDGGASWSRILDPYNDGGIQSCSKNAMHFTDATHGWLTGDCNGVKAGVLLFNTADAGSTWNEITLPAPANTPNLYNDQNNACGSYDPFFFGSDLGILSVRCRNFSGATITSSFYMYSTQDGGSTWSSVAYPGEALYFFTAGTGWALAPKIQLTNDGGKTWKPISNVSWNAEFDFISDTVGWAVATSGDQVALVHTDNAGAKWTILVPTVK